MTTVSLTDVQMRALEISRMALYIHAKTIFSEPRVARNAEVPIIWGHVDITSGGDRGIHGLVGVTVFIRGRVSIGGESFDVVTDTVFEDGSRDTRSVDVRLDCPLLGDHGRCTRKIYTCGEGELPILKKLR